MGAADRYGRRCDYDELLPPLWPAAQRLLLSLPTGALQRHQKGAPAGARRSVTWVKTAWPRR